MRPRATLRALPYAFPLFSNPACSIVACNPGAPHHTTGIFLTWYFSGACFPASTSALTPRVSALGSHRKGLRCRRLHQDVSGVEAWKHGAPPWRCNGLAGENFSLRCPLRVQRVPRKGPNHNLPFKPSPCREIVTTPRLACRTLLPSFGEIGGSIKKHALPRHNGTSPHCAESGRKVTRKRRHRNSGGPHIPCRGFLPAACGHNRFGSCPWPAHKLRPLRERRTQPEKRDPDKSSINQFPSGDRIFAGIGQDQRGIGTFVLRAGKATLRNRNRGKPEKSVRQESISL